MAKEPSQAREKRELAERLVQELASDPKQAGFNPEGIATSLVRQWLSYDGRAALQLPSGLEYLVLGRKPDGGWTCHREPGDTRWLVVLEHDWGIPKERLPDLVHEWNLRQSATAQTPDSGEIRWWVNPQNKHSGIDFGENQDVPPSERELLLKIAHGCLRQHYGNDLPPEDYPILAQAMLRQWKEHHGHAALLSETLARTYKVVPEPGHRGFGLYKSQAFGGIRKQLEAHKIAPDDVPKAIRTMNLGLRFEYQGIDGERYEIWSEPEQGRFSGRWLSGPAWERDLPPIVCPMCRAVLDPWTGEMTRQNCRICGAVVMKDITGKRQES